MAVALATAGGFLAYVGIRDVELTSGLRDMLKGTVPTPRAKKDRTTPPEFTPGSGGGGDSGGGGGTHFGQRIADAARKYLGQPYSWGGAVPTTSGGPGLDCSGLVTWVLVRDIGLTNLPSKTHTVTGQFLGWSGAEDVPRESMAPGDLVCWSGHIGIAINATDMIHAPTIGDVVKIGRVWAGPTIRRVRNPNPTPGVT